MKQVILISLVALWPRIVAGHSVGVFADQFGTDCNLVIPYPGSSVTAHVVGTIDRGAYDGVQAWHT